MSAGAQQGSKWLVVIPDGGLSWHLWCVDFILTYLTDQELLVLDLRDFSLRRRNSKLRRFFKAIYRKNTVDSLIRSVSKKNAIEFVTPRSSQLLPSTHTKYHLENSISFRNGLDSEYFEEVGERVLNESLLSQRTLKKAKNVYDEVSSITQQLLMTRGINRVVTPGGRTLVPAACIAIAKNFGVDITILESNNNSSVGYTQLPANYRSNTDFLKSEISRAWKEGGTSKYSTAEKYLEDKLNRSNTDASNFSHNFDVIFNLQNETHEKTAAIFVTSAFEFESFVPSQISGDLGREHQKKQVQAFCDIAKESGYRLILRGHPPSLGRESLFAMEDVDWYDFCRKNEITYLASNSKVDSQYLMKNASLNAVYVSSAAIESILLGAQTIILGNAEFSNLVPELCAFDENEIKNRIANLHRKTQLEQLYPYAYFMSGYGTEIASVTVSSQNSITYNGAQLDAPRFKSLDKILARK